MNLARFLRTPILKNACEKLLLGGIVTSVCVVVVDGDFSFISAAKPLDEP